MSLENPLYPLEPPVGSNNLDGGVSQNKSTHVQRSSGKLGGTKVDYISPGKNHPDKDEGARSVTERFQSARQRLVNLEVNFIHERTTRLKAIIKKLPLDIGIKTRLLSAILSNSFALKQIKTMGGSDFKKAIIDVINDTDAIDKEEKSLILNSIEGRGIEWISKYGFNFTPNVYHALPQERIKELNGKYIEYKRIGDTVPEEIFHFDTSKEHSMGNVLEYINNRFSNEFVSLMKDNPEKCEFFFGPKDDMVDFYKLLGLELAGELTNSTSRNLFFYNPTNPSEFKIVFLDINSNAMLNHVVLMLKYAEVPLDNITSRGKIEYQNKADLHSLDKKLNEIFQDNQDASKIAILGPRKSSMEYLKNKYAPDKYDENKNDKYTINTIKTAQIGGIRFDYATLTGKAKDSIVLTFKMPNGEIAGDVVRTLLHNGVGYIIMAGAGGGLNESSKVGSCQLIRESSYLSNTIQLAPEKTMRLKNNPEIDLNPECKHVTVDSPLVETKEWLKSTQDDNVQSVDVETYHILCEINGHNGNLKVVPALFMSDIVGTHPLTQPISVDNAYPNLRAFLDLSFDAIDREENEKIGK